MGFLVDSNVIIDLVNARSEWFDWSKETLAKCCDLGPLYYNQIILAEISVYYKSPEEVDGFLAKTPLLRENLPWDAGFWAGKAFLEYKKNKGQRQTPLPDFYIGAHAQVSGGSLITRDSARYKKYFPKVKLIAPD